MPKGERILAQSKRTTPPPFEIFLTDFKLVCFQLVSIFKLVSKYISNWYLLKPSWKLRGGFHSGGVLFKSKEKHLNRGRKFQILKMFLVNLIYIPLTICKKTLKRFSKRFAKTKQVVQMWSKMLNKRNQPCISNETINWFNSKQPLHLPYAN
jgi:hypothetical protein